MDTFITYASKYTFPDNAEQPEIPQHMPVGTFMEFVQFLKQNGFRKCVIRGNEPVLHPAFSDMIQVVKDRGLAPVVETTGMLDEDGLQALKNADCQVYAKLYHPDLYPPKRPFKSLLKSFEVMRGRHEGNDITARIFVDDPQRDYSFIKSIFEVFVPTLIKMELAAIEDPASAQSVTKWIAEHIDDFLKRGALLRFGCHFPACAFTEADVGKLVKRNVQLTSFCLPPLGIRPDGKTYVCSRLVNYPGQKFSGFSSVEETHQYLKQQWWYAQYNFDTSEQCPRCLSRQTNTCTGVCLLQKRLHMSKVLNRLAEKPIEDLSSKELAQAGRFYYAAHIRDKAEEYLLAARRADPRNGEVHLLLARIFQLKGNTDDAELEYGKAARLMPENQTVRQEAVALGHNVES